jgi:hypothetical protein
LSTAARAGRQKQCFFKKKAHATIKNQFRKKFEWPVIISQIWRRFVGVAVFCSLPICLLAVH